VRPDAKTASASEGSYCRHSPRAGSRHRRQGAGRTDPSLAMPYMHKAKWGTLDSLSRKELIIDPHQFSAPVGTIRYGQKDASGKRPVLFWRTKTRCSSNAEWMELHDAETGAVLWRAECRYGDRAAPVTAEDHRGKPKTEFLTVVRLYLESETAPRLMIVHRDKQPGGLSVGACSKVLAVYMLDPKATGGGYKPPAAPGAGGGAGAAGSSNDAAAAGASHEELLEQFDFAALPAGEDIFQLNFNQAMTTLSLAALRLPSQQDLEESLQTTQGVRVNQQDVRTLARLKTLAGMGTNAKRKVEIDSGLDLPLVTMLLCATDQLLLAHEAIDYDVSWPDDYGFAYGECFSSRKKEAEALKATAEYGMQTGTVGERKGSDSARMCFFW
jgi:hypothetical protein